MAVLCREEISEEGSACFREWKTAGEFLIGCSREEEKKALDRLRVFFSCSGSILETLVNEDD